MSKGAKLLIQRQARKILGVGTFPTHCAKAAAYFGVEWSGNKKEGYELLRRLVTLPSDAPRPVKKLKPTARRKSYSQTDAFLLGWEWRTLRMKVLKHFGARCQCCGATARGGVRIHVDHIKPRSTHPELALVETNLQVLCEECNQGKGAWDDTDWREKPAIKPAASPEPIWSGYITTKH